MKNFFLLAIVFFYSSQLAYSQAGQLDPTFGNRGIVKTDMGIDSNYSSSARQVLITPAGDMYIILEPAFISKRLSNGALDSSYGVDGYSRSVPLNNVYAALQADGKIVLAGATGDTTFGLARINTEGVPDSSFGNNGMQTATLNPRSVAIQSDGKIVIAGYTAEGENDTYLAVARYKNNGNIDDSFNGNGQQIIDFGFKSPPDNGEGDSIEIHNAYANAVAIQADGKIIAGGYVYTGKDNDFALVRFNTDGNPDSTFDKDGRQTTGFGTSDEIGYSLAIQSNGKIVFAGYTSSGTLNNFAVARYNVNGSLDNTFSGDGKQTAVIGSDMQNGNSVAIQSNGKIVVAGYTLKGVYNDFAIVRFNTNGTLDNTFDDDGKVTTDLSSSSDDYATSLAIQSDDKIVVAGFSYDYSSGNTIQRFALTRCNINGDLDSSFNNDGKLLGNYKQGYTAYNSTVIQADGKILAAGITWNGINYDFGVARYNTNGSIDSTFDEDGNQTTDFGGQEDNANSIAIQKDGKIIVAGNSDSKFSIARYNANGSLDNTFKANGQLLISLGFSDVFNAVALQSDGKIVMAGYTFLDANFDSADFAIVRLNTDGTLDNTFNGSGKVITDFDSSMDFASSVAIQTDGKIVVAGRSVLDNRNNFSIVRYNTDGSLDHTFSHDGKQHSVFGDGGFYGTSLALENDGKIVMGGFNEQLGGLASSFVVARYNTNGEPDSTFNDFGFQNATLGSHFNFGNSVGINDDGRIGLGGTNDNYAIILCNKNGSLDNTFSNDGIQTTMIGTGNSSIQSIAFAGNKLYAAGNGDFPGTLGVVARYLLAASGPLPLSLLDFKAILQNKQVLLQWKIATEKNISGFIVERSADGNKFFPIKNVTAVATSSFAKDYSILDEQPLQGVNFYRLKLIDADDKFSYSNTIAVKLNATNKLQVFPNPAKDILFVQASGGNEIGTVQIVDFLGRTINEFKVTLNNNTFFSINVNVLPAGIYTLILHKKQNIEVQQFIKK